jgi:hypothetical protein
MRLPRMTTRRWLIAVAVVAVALAASIVIERRRHHFRTLAERHSSAELSCLGLAGRLDSPALAASWKRKAERCARLAQKYRRAARYPWLPVEPDPPEPE